MNAYSALCDDFYLNMNLTTEMELPCNRETILHFFDRIQKSYPEMSRFHSRDRCSFLLEEEKNRGKYRWCSIEPYRMASGMVNPQSLDSVLSQHSLMLELAPFHLSVSPLDCEGLDVLFGFDFTYCGNHHQLIAESLGICSGLDAMSSIPGTRLVNYEPSLTLAVDDQCRRLLRVSIENRTDPMNVRNDDFPEEQLSVYVTAKQFGSIGPEASLESTMMELVEICQDYLDQYVIERVLDPLARTIALK